MNANFNYCARGCNSSFLIVKLKLNTFVSLVTVSLVVGLLLGIPIGKINTVIEDGIGSQLGSLAIVFGLGAMLGRLIADSGQGSDCHGTK